MVWRMVPLYLYLTFGVSLGNAEPGTSVEQRTQVDAARKDAQPILREVFQGQFTKDQLAQFGEKSFELKDLTRIMSPEQSAGARARLRELESGAVTPAELEQIAEGYLLLASSEDTARIASRLLEENPGNPKAYHLTSEAQSNLRNYPAAAEAAKAALKINPNDRVALAHWMSTKGRIDSSHSALPPAPFSPKEGEGTVAPGRAGTAYSALPAIAAKSVLANLPSPPAPVDAEPIPKDASIGTIAKVAFTAAATATGGLLLFLGLGGGKMEEQFPNIRRNMGIAAGVSGAIAVGAISLPMLAATLSPTPVVGGAVTAIAASKTPQVQSITSSVLSAGQRWVNQAGQAVTNIAQKIQPGQTAVLEQKLVEEFSALQTLGRTGSSQRIRLVDGGVQEAQALFQRLSSGGRVLPQTTYPGKLVEFANGARVGLRLKSSSGPPTIDVHAFPGFAQNLEIKFMK